MKKIFITGGHYTPAKAVIDKLPATKWQIYYIGRKTAMEGDRALSLEFQEISKLPRIIFLEITTGRLQRRLTGKTIPSLLKFPLGLIQSMYFILKFRPDVIMSFGGYVAIPVVISGFILGVPILHHEQVSVFDFPSKLLIFLAKKVMVSFRSQIEGKTSEKWIYTGNPLRKEIFVEKYSPELLKLNNIKQKNKQKLIYITGGNQGSHSLNILVQQILSELVAKFLIIWQTGDSKMFNDFEKIQTDIDNLPDKYREKILVRKFIFEGEIGAVYGLSDLIIGRSGANTVFELAALSKPAILIPLPWAHQDEQSKNARELAKTGQALLLDQNSLTPEKLLQAINETVINFAAMKSSAEKSKALVSLDAAEKISAEIEKYE